MDSVVSRSVEALAYHGGALYVGCQQGLYRYSGEQLERVIGLPEGPVVALCHDESVGGLLALGRGWLGRLVEDRFELLCKSSRLDLGRQGAKSRLASGRSGEICIVGVGTSKLWRDNKLIELSRDLMVGDGRCQCCAYDDYGNLWLGTVRGLVQVISSPFKHYHRATGMLNDEVASIAETTDGRIILGHESGLSIIGEGEIQGLMLPFDGAFSLARGRVLDLEPEIDSGGEGAAKLRTPKKIFFSIVFGKTNNIYLYTTCTKS